MFEELIEQIECLAASLRTGWDSITDEHGDALILEDLTRRASDAMTGESIRPVIVAAHTLAQAWLETVDHEIAAKEAEAEKHAEAMAIDVRDDIGDAQFEYARESSQAIAIYARFEWTNYRTLREELRKMPCSSVAEAILSQRADEAVAALVSRFQEWDRRQVSTSLHAR